MIRAKTKRKEAQKQLKKAEKEYEDERPRYFCGLCMDCSECYDYINDLGKKYPLVEFNAYE